VRKKPKALSRTVLDRFVPMNIPTQKSDARAATRGAASPRKGVNWFRFWMQMLVAVLIFNVIAGLVTWFIIFPKLHPGM